MNKRSPLSPYSLFSPVNGSAPQKIYSKLLQVYIPHLNFTNFHLARVQYNLKYNYLLKKKIIKSRDKFCDLYSTALRKNEIYVY